METVSTQIRNFRIKQHLSVERLGRLINVPDEDIWKMERGNFLLSTWQLVQVAAKLNTDVMNLLMAKKRQLIALGQRNGATGSVRITRLKKELEQWEHDSPVIRLMPGSEKILLRSAYYSQKMRMGSLYITIR